VGWASDYLKIHATCEVCNKNKAEKVAYSGSEPALAYCLECLSREFRGYYDNCFEEGWKHG
jgi:hypothetical protein